MAIIKDYPFADGHTEDIEVTEEFAREYEKIGEEFNRNEKQAHRRMRRGKLVSLEKLLKQEYDFEDPINCDPEELYIESMEIRLPMLSCLTEYQKRVAFKFFVEHKTKTEIAKEESVGDTAIRNIIQKVIKKILNNYA